MSTCNHKWNGPSVLISESGKIITLYTYKQYISYTDAYRVQVIEAYHESIADPIVEVIPTCSKCGKHFNPILDTPF